jgi:hypothetical protein
MISRHAVAAIHSLLVAALFAGAMPSHSQEADTTPPPADPESVVDTIAGEVSQIRGLPFKHPVAVEKQSSAQFGEYVSQRIDKAVPEGVRRHYGAIVRTLGLYRGPPIDDFRGMMTTVMTSQVGAYYDPDKQRFFVLMNGMPELAQGALYAHELYHALQDQYFGLASYLEMGTVRRARSFNGDARIAREAVVEGEATYMMTLWMMQRMTHSTPPRELLAQVVGVESNLSMDQLREALKQPQVAQLVGNDVQSAVQSSADIPPFILDSMMGAYLKGLNFVFAVHERGWPAVEKLYAEYPPQSTEQILHPEKWLAHEAPVRFEWPNFEKLAALKDWELIDDDVLGEFQLRTVFKVQGLASEAESAASGWGGDRYAVFKRKDSDATLLLMRTAWDREVDARKFVDAYRRALTTKYADAPVPTRVVQNGVDVFIVEGGDEARIDSLLRVVRQVKKEVASSISSSSTDPTPRSSALPALSPSRSMPQ